MTPTHISRKALKTTFALTLVAAAAFTPRHLSANPTDEQDIPHEQKGYRESGYDLSQYENINLANGNLVFQVPLYTVSTNGGLSYDLSLSYNSKVWYTKRFCGWMGSATNSYAHCAAAADAGDGEIYTAEVADGVGDYGFGWDLRPPRILLSRQLEFEDRRGTTLVMSSGARHQIACTVPWEADPDAPCSDPFATGYTLDDSAYRFSFVRETGGEERIISALMEDGTGTHYVFEHIVPVACDNEDEIPTGGDNLEDFNFKMETSGLYLTRMYRGPFDAGGNPANVIEFEYEAEANSQYGWGAACTPGVYRLSRVVANANLASDQQRAVQIRHESSTACDDVEIEVPSFAQSGEASGSESICLDLGQQVFSQRYDYRPGDNTAQFSSGALERVAYPDSTTFEFAQNGVGQLSQVTLPSGATVDYVFEKFWPLGYSKSVQGTMDSCDIQFDPTNDVGAAGDDGVTITVTNGDDVDPCPWTANVFGGADWLQVTDVEHDDSLGGSFTYSVAPNAGNLRIGEIAIVGETHLVCQEGTDGQLCEDQQTEGLRSSILTTAHCGAGAPARHDWDGTTYFQSSLHMYGITRRSITYGDALDDPQVESMWLRQALNCSVNQRYSGISDLPFWPHGMNYALEETKADGEQHLPQPEYLWTVVLRGSGTDPYAMDAVGSAEIHRFHSTSRQEFAVEHLEGPGCMAPYLDLISTTKFPENPDKWHDNGAYRASLQEIERDSPAVGQSGVLDVNDSDYQYVRETRSYVRPSSVDADGIPVSLQDCYGPVQPIVGVVPSVTCPAVVTTRTVDDYLNTTSESTVTMNMPFVVDRQTANEYKSFDGADGTSPPTAEDTWLLHRQTRSTVSEGAQDLVTEWRWSAAEVGNSYSTIQQKTVNPQSLSENPEEFDTVIHSYGYDDFGNRAQETTEGGYRALPNGKPDSQIPNPYGDRLTVKTHWQHGQAVQKSLLAQDGSHLLLWARDVDPGTGLIRWHVNGSGAGYLYDYDSMQRLTDIVPVEADYSGGPPSAWTPGSYSVTDWTLSIPTVAESDGDGLTPVLGTRVAYQPATTTSLRSHQISDAAYTLTGNRIQSSVPQTLREVLAFDGLGRLTRETQYLPPTLGDTTARTRRRVTTNRFTTDAGTDAVRQQRTSTWFPLGADPADLVFSTTKLDQRGRPTSVEAPDGTTTWIAYPDEFTTVTSAPVAAGLTATGDDDPQTRARTEVRDALDRIREVTEEIDSDAQVTTFYDYDVADRLIRVQLGSQTRTFGYSGIGVQTSSTEPERTTTVRAADARGQVLYQEVGDSYGAVGSTDRFNYRFGQLETKEILPPGSVEWLTASEIEYDFAPQSWGPSYGKPTTATQHNYYGTSPSADDSVQVWHRWKYDGPAGRVSTRETGFALAVGGVGQTPGRFRQAYAYDQWGNLATTLFPTWIEGLADAGEDCGRLLYNRRTYDGSWLQSVAYDFDNEAPDYTPEWSQIAGFDYRINGRVGRTVYGPSEMYPDGVAELTEFVDPDGMARPGGYQLTYIEPVWGGQWTLWSELDYAYDARGNLWSRGDRRYTYDGLSRLKSAQRMNAAGTAVESVEAYSYDSYGNLEVIDRTGDETDLSLTPDPATNQLKSVNGLPLSAGAYDSRGNLLFTPAVGDQPQLALSYSPEDRLMRAAITDGADTPEWSYAYDTSGERVLAWRRNSGSGTPVSDLFVTLRDEAGRVLSKWTMAPNAPEVGFRPIMDYVDGGGGSLAQLSWDAIGTPELRYLVPDHLGSTRHVFTTYNGHMSHNEFRPFGALDAEHSYGIEATDLLFTGHERDQPGADLFGETNTGLDYMHARYYSPNLGRFMSVDPVGGTVGSSQSWNRYSYVLNEPVGLIDPDGRDVELANRPVQDFPLSNHAYIVITPTGGNAERYKNRINKEGHIVLSGGPGLGRSPETGRVRTSLVKWDSDRRSKARQLIKVQPAGQSTEQFEINVIEAFDSYEDGSLPYNNVDVGGKNSNAFASGVLSAAGAGEALPSSGDLEGWNPGWSDPIDLPDATANDAEAGDTNAWIQRKKDEMAEARRRGANNS